ncbi:MAG: hypothetical protein ACE149_05540 [Armatimonadota bacterium]
MARMTYVAQWSARWLYLAGDRLLIPWGEGELFALARDEGMITGVAAAEDGTFVLTIMGATGPRFVRITAGHDDDDGPTALRVRFWPLRPGWWGAPAYLSPDKRWLLCTVSALLGGAAEGSPAPSAAYDSSGATELWLLDCAGEEPSRPVPIGGSAQRCFWSPSGRYAVLDVSGPPTGRSVVLLDASSGRVDVLTPHSGSAIWSAESSEVLVCLETGQQLRFAVREGAVNGMADLSWAEPVPRSAVWSNDGTAAAWTEEGGSELIFLRGARRWAVAAPPPVLRVLAWSPGGEVVAYVDTAGALQFRTSVSDVRVIERIRAAAPPGRRGDHGSTMGIALSAHDTSLTVRSPENLMGAWTRLPQGPCFVWVEPSDGGQRMRSVLFRYGTLGDIGIDPTGDIRRQIIKRYCDGNLITVGMAIRLYADDHDGRFPPHETGPSLVGDLEPYLGPHMPYGSAYAPDDMRVRLLYPGATRDEVLSQAAEAGQTQVPLLELQGDDGLTFYQLTDGSVQMVRPDGGTEMVSSWD